MSVIKKMKKAELASVLKHVKQGLVANGLQADVAYSDAKFKDFFDQALNPKLTKRVASAVVMASIKSRDECPITLEPIGSAAKIDVTTCGHCFVAGQLKTHTCPTCREHMTWTTVENQSFIDLT